MGTIEHEAQARQGCHGVQAEPATQARPEAQARTNAQTRSTSSQRRSVRGQAPDDRITPLAEQWPNLRFLGLGAWWAWIWLCFNSVEIMRLFPADSQTAMVMDMYIASTIGISLSMLGAALAAKHVNRLLERRGFVVALGAVACAATLALSFSSLPNARVLFVAMAVVTGVSTAVLCLKVGKVYGSVSVGEAFIAAALSLLFAACLYFVGVGIPQGWRAFYIAVLPLVSAFLLVMPHEDAYETGSLIAPQDARADSPIFHMFIRLVAATALVAFTAGLGKGISSVLYTTEEFALEGTVTVFVIGIVAVAIMVTVNYLGGGKGARVVYTSLMVLGIAMMLATCFGLPVGYLSIGKEVLWLVFSCFIAYLTFRFNLSAVRMFGIAQAVYFLSSLLGWIVGGQIAPYYEDPTVRMACGMLMAFAVVLVLIYVLPERKVGRIMSLESKASSPASVLTAVEASCAAVRSSAGDASATASGSVEASGATVASSHVPAGVVAAAAALAVDGPGIAASATAGAGEGVAAAGVAVNGAADTFSAADESVSDLNLGIQKARDPKYGLSSRELEVLDLFAQGRSANWIADYFVISKNTVRSHLRSIYTKLDVHTRQELLDFLAGRN